MFFSVPGREGGVQICINTYQWRRLQIKSAKTPYPCLLWQIDGETVETMADFIFWGPKSLQMVTAAMKLKDAYFLKEKL